MAHARRKFYELHVHHQSHLGTQTLRQARSRPIADALQQWLLQQRSKVPNGAATAKVIDYSLKRSEALVRFVGNGDLPVGNNWVENQILPVALGRKNWLFAGSLRAGQRVAAVMRLIHSARLKGNDSYANLKDVLTRMPTAALRNCCPIAGALLKPLPN